VIHFGIEMADALFFDEQSFLVQAQHPAQADTAAEPDLDLMTEAGSFCGQVFAMRWPRSQRP